MRATPLDPRAAAATPAVFAGGFVVDGRFAVAAIPGGVATAPKAVAAQPGRVTLVRAVAGLWPEPAEPSRLARALRQDLWRRLRRARGFAPLVIVRDDPAGAAVTLAACFLDGAAAAPSTLDALDGIFQDAAARRWRNWARGARAGAPRA